MSYAQTRPKGISGWLLLPLINLAGNTGWLTYSLILGALGSELPRSGDAGAAQMAAGAIAPWLVHGYAIFNVIFDVFGAICLVLFLERKKTLRRMMEGFYILMLAHAGWGAGLAMQTPQYPDHLIQLFAAVIACGVWIPYFRVSERVKNTFVR
jgi:hypothetical protein